MHSPQQKQPNKKQLSVLLSLVSCLHRAWIKTASYLLRQSWSIDASLYESVIKSEWKFRSMCSVSYVPLMALESSSSDWIYPCQWSSTSAVSANQPRMTLRPRPIQGYVEVSPWQWGQYRVLSKALPQSLEKCRWSVVLITSIPKFRACKKVQLGNSDLPVCPMAFLDTLPFGGTPHIPVKCQSDQG